MNDTCDHCSGRGVLDSYQTGDAEGRTCPHCNGTGATEEHMNERKRTEMLVYIRPAVLAFACEMERKLRKNDHKTEATEMPDNCLIKRLQAEVLELDVATQYEKPSDVAAEAADVGNFALFLFARATKMTIKRDK